MAPAPATESLSMWRPRDLPGVEVVHVAASDQLRAGISDEHTISLVTKGSVEWWHGGREYTTSPGEIGVAPAGDLHRLTRQAGRLDYWALRVGAPCLAGALEEMDDPQPVAFRSLQLQDSELARRLLGLFRSLRAGATLLERETRLAAVLRRVRERHTERPARSGPERLLPTSVRLARDFLHDNLAGNVSLDGLARASHSSKYYLARLFTRTLGLPPHQYLRLVRLAHARTLLRGGMPAAQAAAESGFADQSHLTRAFRGTYGYTPGQYARGAADPIRAVRPGP